MRRRLAAARTQSPNIMSRPMPVRSLVGVHLGQLHPEPHGEVLVPEVVAARSAPAPASHTASTVSSVVFDSPYVDGHPLDVVEDGGAQVVDGDHVAHHASSWAR